MSEEIELKLSLPESEQARLLRLPLLRQAITRHASPLLNLYYDTPDLALHHRGVALRLRRKGKQWLQTVKCAGDHTGALTMRPEWETPYGGHFDFSAIHDEKLRHWLTRPRIHEHIVPLFETNFRRITWRFEPTPGTIVQLALDRGWIAANGHREPISEVELELESGDVSGIFMLAERLADKIPLAPAVLSKAERGYRLYTGHVESLAKATDIPLTPSMPPVEAFRRIAFACLAHMQANHDAATRQEDPEYIHQMRVAVRRLRAALRIFSPLLPKSFAKQLMPPLRSVMTTLGKARDLDVLFSDIVSPVNGALPDEPRLAALAGLITESQYEARQTARDFLRSKEYGQFLLLATRLLHELTLDSTTPVDTSLPTFAIRRLKKQRRRLIRLLAAVKQNDPAALHVIRIAVKRMRYGLEFFAPLLEKKAVSKNLRDLVRRQETLGQLNDLSNAGNQLMVLADDDARLREAVTLIAGWHGQRYADLLKDIPATVKALGCFKLPRIR